MGKSSKPSDTQTVTNKVELPPWLDQRLQSASGTAESLYSGGNPPYYPGQTVVPFSGESEQAMDLTRGLALNGIPGMQQASDAFSGTAGGDYLYGGPGFNAAMGAAQRDIVPRVQSAFGRAGRHQSGLAQAAVAEELGDAFAGMYGDERQRQMQSLALAPQFEGLAYQPAGRLSQVGGLLESQEGAQMQDAMARWTHDAYQPQTEFDQYLSRLQGIAPMAGQTSTQQNPLYTNRGAGIAGGAMTGLGLASSLGQMPYFGAAGAGAAMAPWLAPIGLGAGLLSSIF